MSLPILAPLGLGPLELGLILLIVVLVFGVGRLPEVGGAVGKGIREFRKATKDDEAEAEAKAAAAMQSSAAPADAAPAAPVAAPSTDTIFCSECGAKNPRNVKFCSNCGHSIGSAAS
jgi:sec-independent protein translocase protein TatA